MRRRGKARALHWVDLLNDLASSRTATNRFVLGMPLAFGGSMRGKTKGAVGAFLLLRVGAL